MTRTVFGRDEIQGESGRRGLPPGIWVIGLLGVALLVGVLAERGMFAPVAEMFAPPTKTPRPPTKTPRPPTKTPRPPTKTPRPPTETPRPSTSTPTPEPTVDPAVVALAMKGVTRDNEWEPYTQKIDGVEMALVPAGCFMMGSFDHGYEQPVHEVCFEEPFWIDVYEVTNAQYGSSGKWSGDNLPRENVTWYNARNHCKRRGAWLPTEAEWEYAARGPDGLIYPWGNVFDGELLNFCDKNCKENWADKNAVDSYQYTAPVGSYPGGVSWVGAYDLSGNVWEWVADRYGTYPGGRQVNPTGPDSGQERVLRGGSYHDQAFGIRAAARDRESPGDRYINVGFRCVLPY